RIYQLIGQPECVAPVAAPVPASTDLAATFIITSGSVLLILLFIASLWFLLRPRFEEKTPVATVELPPGQRSTDGSAPRVDQTARPTGADPTGAPPSCKSEETGSADSPTAECVTSALALTQRVRDLGLHLGDIVVTGLSIGLPNALTGRPVFDEANLSLLMRGDNLIGPLPEDMLQAQLDRNVVQVHKAADGTRVRKPLNMVEDVIKLASRIGQFDLVSEYGLSPAIVETLDTTYALAVAAGLEALRNAGLIDAPPKKERSDFASAESTTDSDWRLSREHRDETGVVFASSFPALDSLIEELSRAMANAVDRTRAQTRKQARDEWLRGLREMATRRAQEEQAADAAPSEKAVRMAALAELNKWLAEEEALSADGGEDVGHHELNRKLLFKLLVMANAQLAEIVQVLGVRQANSAYHASAICVKHATEQLELLLRDIEALYGIGRRELASSLLYVSHETFTYARNGGCAGAEVTALRAAFGDDLRKVLITNSKGITGHAMGVCFEDVVAVASLSSGLVPPIVNYRECDPVLGPLRLSTGGSHDCRYALHFAAGFGSQVSYIMYAKPLR
ncbi:beta-ketoacyl-ACP-synthase, partial [Chrysochromulina tobinii]